MTTREDVTRLSQANQRIVAAAIAQLEQLFGRIDFTLPPELIRDALLEVVPGLVSQYGDLAADVAAQWYAQTRTKQVPGNFQPRLGTEVDLSRVAGSVRAAVGPLWDEDPAQVLRSLSGMVQRQVTNSARETVSHNAEHDPAKPRFARVPSGRKTCAFCVMLASRGWVYSSRELAQTSRDGSSYHDHCDCQIVPEWDKDAAHIAGYDPDRLYEMYANARAEARSHDPKKIAAKMRELYPDNLSDGLRSGAESVAVSAAGTLPIKPLSEWLSSLPRLDRPDSYSEASYWANGGAVRTAAGAGYGPKEYTNNCHQVVSAMELRARGYDVTASPTLGAMGRTSGALAADWIDPATGKPRSFTRPQPRARSWSKAVESATADWPNGSRGFVLGEWKKRGGHVFNVEKTGDGKIVIVEGQIPNSQNHFALMKPSTISALRVDDLEPSQLIRDKVTSVSPEITSAQQLAFARQRVDLIDEYVGGTGANIDHDILIALEYEDIAVRRVIKDIEKGA